MPIILGYLGFSGVFFANRTLGREYYRYKLGLLKRDAQYVGGRPFELGKICLLFWGRRFEIWDFVSL